MGTPFLKLHHTIIVYGSLFPPLLSTSSFIDLTTFSPSPPPPQSSPLFWYHLIPYSLLFLSQLSHCRLEYSPHFLFSFSPPSPKNHPKPHFHARFYCQFRGRRMYSFLQQKEVAGFSAAFENLGNPVVVRAMFLPYRQRVSSSVYLQETCVALASEITGVQHVLRCTQVSDEQKKTLIQQGRTAN